MKKADEKIMVANPILGICNMIVCCERKMTKREILSFCNSANPSGTRGGWQKIYSQKESDKKMRPVKCDDYENHMHVLVGC